MNFILFVLLACCVPLHVSAQTLSSAVQSVTTYKSCAVSPLNQAPLSSGSNATNFQNPCDNIGQSETVTEIRVTVFPRRVAGEDNFVFNLKPRHSNQPGLETTYNINDICGGSVVGSNCTILNDKLDITIESTALYAKYEMKRRKYSVPYWYEVFTCDNVLFTSSTGLKPVFNDRTQFGQSTDCFELSTNTPGLDNTGDSEAVCEVDASKISKFATPGSTQSLDDPGKTTTLYCATDLSTMSGGSVPSDSQEEESYVSIQAFRNFPMCSAFDISSKPLGLMNLRITVNNGTSSQQIILSTTDGGAVNAVPNQMYARINRINTGVGQIGNILSGLMVTCIPSSDGDGSGNEYSGILDDTASQTTDGFSIKNPWSVQVCQDEDCSGQEGEPGILDYVNCNIPVAPCRANIGGSKPNSFWYYVPSDLISQYGTFCNQNGVDPDYLYTNAGSMFEVCEAAAACQPSPGTSQFDGLDADCTIYNGQCIPGYDTPASLNTQTFSRALTPCQVNQQMATFAEEYVEGDFSKGYFWMPPGYDPANPNFWVKGTELLTNALGGDSDEVSVDLSIYVVGEFLGEIQTASTAVFETTAQICTAVEGGEGSAIAVVRNTGASAGRFLVTATFFTTNETAAFTIETSSVPNTNTGAIFQDVAVNAFANVRFDYFYSGSDGNNVEVEFTLSSLVGNGELVLLQEVRIGCVITGGIDIPEPDGSFRFRENPPGGVEYQCDGTFNIFCWNNLSISDWIGHFIMLTLLLIPALLAVLTIVYLCADVHYMSKQVEYAKKMSEYESEAARLGRQNRR